MIEKILVAIDGSEQADKALYFALDFAETCDAEIVILNVFHEPVILFTNEMCTYPFTDPTLYTFDADLMDMIKNAHRKMLAEARHKAQTVHPDLHISTTLKEGRPADTIVNVAREGNFGLIVMGHRGLGRVTEFFLGSVSDRVADTARCPVLIVK